MVKPYLAAVVIVVVLAVGLFGGYFVSTNSISQRTTTSTTTSTSTYTTTSLTETTATSTLTETSTITQTHPQYLTPAEGQAEGASFAEVSCPSVCNTTAGAGSVSYFFPIPGMTSFYSQVDVNGTTPGLGAGVYMHEGQVEITLTNTNTYNACFEYLVSQSPMPPTIYVWYYGQNGCP